jgi:sugar lactone lactonase YvrE
MARVAIAIGRWPCVDPLPGKRLIPGLLTLAVLAGTGPSASVAEQRAPLDTRVFAQVGEPGHPDPIAVDHNRTVYVGSLTSFSEMTAGRNDTNAPSEVWAFGPDGRLLRSYRIAGQALDEDHALTGIALDAEGRLYINDTNPARVIRLDPSTGSQAEYARFRDVPPCFPGRTGDCSAETLDRDSLPNGAAFAPDGSLFVTDYRQGLIWRVPRGGGRPEVWFTDPQLASTPFALNGIRFLPDRSSLMFVQTNTNTPSGRLYTLQVRADGSPGGLALLYETQPFDGPDSFAVAKSGNVYLALAGSNQLVKLSPTGQELARVSGPGRRGDEEIPFDSPADVAFLGERILVSNSAFLTNDPSTWAVFDVFAGERGASLVRPRMTRKPQHRPVPRIRLSVQPRTGRSRTPTTFRFLAAYPDQGEWRRVRGAKIRFAKKVAYTNDLGRATISQRFTHPATYRPHARKRRLRTGKTTVRVRA